MKETLENFLSELELVVQADLAKGEAFASVNLNPNLRWMKFILLDDQPNENKQRVPQKEFQNIIKTGIHMPIKMAEGAIADGHDEARPIGVITHLKQIKNRIEGLAALWSKERPEDIDYVLEEFNSGSVPQISYELPYADSEKTEAGIENLFETSLRAATLVNLPAFAGRTPIVAMASKEESDTNLEDDKLMDELETLKQDHEKALDTIKELEKDLAEMKEAQASTDKELEELREFKAEVDKEAEEADKLDKIEKKFAEAGIKKDDEYFETNKERLLSLDSEALDFMVQEMVAFANKEEDKSKDLDNDDGIPPMKGDKDTAPKSMKEFADALNAEMRKDK
jgi:hypothetical protein